MLAISISVGNSRLSLVAALKSLADAGGVSFLVSPFHFLVVRKKRHNPRDLTKDILCYPKGVKHCVPLLE